METRDIEKYTNDYLNHDVEAVMIKFRRKKVLEVLKKEHYKAEIPRWIVNLNLSGTWAGEKVRKHPDTMEWKSYSGKSGVGIQLRSITW